MYSYIKMADQSFFHIYNFARHNRKQKSPTG